MHHRLLLLFFCLLSTPIQELRASEIRISHVTREEQSANTTWRTVLSQAQREKKPVVILFVSPSCDRCERFEHATLAHPAIQRRLAAVVFAKLPSFTGEASNLWNSEYAGVALFDRAGAMRAGWFFVPDTTNFGVILDSVLAVAPDIERAAQLADSGKPHEAEVEAARALARLGRNRESRVLLLRARDAPDLQTQHAALLLSAILDANEGQTSKALTTLEKIVADTPSPLAADAWMAIAAIHRSKRDLGKAVLAYENAGRIAGEGTDSHKEALRAIAALQAADNPPPVPPIRILSLGRQVVSGRHRVRTHVSSAAVAQVVFSIDGRQVSRVNTPPYSAMIDFGEVPERRSILVTAFDARGREVGRNERIVNDAGESFGLRLLEPRSGPVRGMVPVRMSLRTPSTSRLRRLVISWNEIDRAELTGAPWEAFIEISDTQPGVLRVVAELDDGRTSEDAVLLNTHGMVEETDVQLVEMPMTLLRRNVEGTSVTAERIIVREGDRVRRAEAVSDATETPLTVGLLIDLSASMQATLPDVQEAAVRFIETTLGERDRAFLIAFDTAARLVQPATSDIGLLRRSIMSIRPEGLTALHDAMVLGLLQFEGIKGRRAMIVFTDGLDLSSRYRARDVSDLARRANIPIHLIASVPGIPAALRTGTAGNTIQAVPETREHEHLRVIARSTGGTSHILADLAALPLVYSEIEAALRAQILAFFRTERGKRENEWRSIQVEIEGEGLDIHAPEGYYAPW
ncbi:MAG TPA: VWA domain-containing protein [Thermoanaerobaculia bacterium]